MNRRLFREEALARRGRAEPLDGLLRVTAPHMWAVLVGLALLLAGAFAWALLDRVDETVDADCVFVLPGARVAVFADGTGVVEEVLVDTGDAVEAGQPLARLRTPGLDRQLAVARAVLAELETASGAPADPGTSPTLTAARAEVHQLEAMRATGLSVASAVAGEIAELDMVPGQAVEAGSRIALVRVGGGTHPEVVAFVPQDSARLLRTGQPATVMRAAAGGDALSAEVSHISSRPATADDWLTDLGLSPPPRSHLVTLSSADLPSVEPADGEACRARIVVGTHAPIRLLGTALNAGRGSA